MPARSQNQQKLFALALSVKRGKTPRKGVTNNVLDIVDKMSEKDIKDYAETSPAGLPKKVRHESFDNMTKIRKVIREQLKVLTEAKEISITELPKDKQQLVGQYAKIFNGKVMEVFDGIHGYVVNLKVSPQPGKFRFVASDLKKLLNLKIRWIEGEHDTIVIGF